MYIYIYINIWNDVVYIYIYSNPKCRLINPAKTEIGIICKKYLENVNKQITESTRLNQWRNTHSVIA